jgi:hypothetical protein
VGIRNYGLEVPFLVQKQVIAFLKHLGRARAYGWRAARMVVVVIEKETRRSRVTDPNCRIGETLSVHLESSDKWLKIMKY